MILFSIAVHERPEVVVNQVENFTYFNPGCQVVLHVSAWMPEDVFRVLQDALSAYAHVHINTTRLWSGYGDGTQMKMHVVNYSYARKLGLPFDYFCLHASNDMFVKAGLGNYMSAFDAGNNPVRIVWEDKRWAQSVHALSDRLLKKMMKKYGLSEIYGTQVEGSFYRKDIMDTVVSRIMKDGYYELPGIYAQGTSRPVSKIIEKREVRFLIKHLLKGMLYAKEETYFSTLSQDIVHNRAPYSYCYVNWLDNLKISRADIDNIREGNTGRLALIGDIQLIAGQLQFFAVKRIDRKIDDPMRVYITGLQNTPLQV